MNQSLSFGLYRNERGRLELQYPIIVGGWILRIVGGILVLRSLRLNRPPGSLVNGL